jgi:SagB-type dehydrogenase family enzyme
MVMTSMNANEVAAIESPSETYHEASKLRSEETSLATIYSVNNFPQIRRIIAKPAMSRNGFPTFALPKEFGGIDHGAAQLFLKRESSRTFSGVSISVIDLAAILYFGAAVTREAFDEFGIKWGFRCAPSGGALYPVDIYCVINRVVSLDAGLYFYDPSSHALQLLKKQGVAQALAKATYSTGSTSASFCVLLVGNFGRSKFKYGERAYRFVLLEAGHICQNMLLMINILRHSAFPLGGFLDDVLNDLIGIDGRDEAVVYGVMAGCAE